MKAIIPIAILAVTGLVCAQSVTTTPVGYTTVTLKPNMYNLVGITMHNPTAVAGIIDSATASTVVDNDVDFTAVLGAPGAPDAENGDPNETVYILELPDGTIQEITSWSGNTLNTPEDISSKIGSGAYKIRKASTVADIFGATNSAGLTATDGESEADVIMIYDGSVFVEVSYYNDGSVEGWVDADGNLAGNKVISYSDAFFVSRVAGNSINLVVAGEVKVYPTAGVLSPGWNYVSGVVPVGLTLDTSNLQNAIQHSEDGSFDVDNVVLQNEDGTYMDNIYYDDGSVEGWLNGDSELTGSEDLSKGFLIRISGAGGTYVLPAPVIAP